MVQQFLETDQGFINVRLIERIFWDKRTDGWALEWRSDRPSKLAYPTSEDAVRNLLGEDPLG
jgi:hypothetical protein